MKRAARIAILSFLAGATVALLCARCVGCPWMDRFVELRNAVAQAPKGVK